LEGYRYVAEQMVQKFGLKKAAITLRESISASENIWSACLHNGRDFLQGQRYKILVIDRIGAGDSFCSGLIYCLASGKSDQEALEFGVAASCLKHSIPGDYNLVSAAEVAALMGGEASGRVQR
jgi:2-dehydro-3-deoxygluconokinase